MKNERKIMTSKEAGKLLKGQKINRPLSPRLVNEMVEDIKNEVFDPTQANVCLHEDGSLFYGQHILNAIKKLKADIELYVWTLEGNEEHTHRAGSLNKDSKYKYQAWNL